MDLHQNWTDANADKKKKAKSEKAYIRDLLIDGENLNGYA